MGTYSSLEITWLGTGRWRSSHASRSDLRIHPLWAWGFGQDGTLFGLDIFTTGTTANFIGQDYCSTTRFTTALCSHFFRMLLRQRELLWCLLCTSSHSHGKNGTLAFSVRREEPGHLVVIEREASSAQVLGVGREIQLASQNAGF